MTRYKGASENAEVVEDELKAEKRKVQREVQQPNSSAFIIKKYTKLYMYI